MHIQELTPDPGERHMIFGGTRSGKSSFQDWSLRTVQATRPDAMQILVDTKPRFRAETERGPFGRGRRNAAHRYSSWSKGPVVPNSVALDLWDDNPFRGVFQRPGEIAVLQSGESQDWKRILALLQAYTKANVSGRERRVIVDECLDFYQRNTWGIDPKNDVFYRVARAGGERNIGLDMGAHQVSGVPPLILKMLSRATLFHLRTDRDMKYLQDIGIRDAESPEGNYVFRQYRVQPGGVVSDPITGSLELPESYLAQLSTT
jgi:hypothetical protein